MKEEIKIKNIRREGRDEGRRKKEKNKSKG